MFGRRGELTRWLMDELKLREVRSPKTAPSSVFFPHLAQKFWKRDISSALKKALQGGFSDFFGC